MTAEQLRAVLDWRMCSDPWPGGDMDAVDDWLDGVCREGGYQNWVEAYHLLVGAPEIFPGTLAALRRLGANDRVEGRAAMKPRRVPSHDGLCGAVDSENGT